MIDSQVRGTTSGDRGLVTISGAARLDGTLNITFVNAFDPDAGTSFPAITFESRSGTFASVTSSGLGAGKAVQATHNATDVTIVVAAALRAEGVGSDEGQGASEVESSALTTDALQEFVSQSQSRLDPRSRVGLVNDVPRLRFGLVNDVEFIVTDLQNNLLGTAAGHIIWIDQDAAGFGWFVDASPNDDVEFAPGGAANGRMDLLTVLAHELGHVLGQEHDPEPGHLMSETLATGIRLLPIGTSDEIDHVFTNPDWP